MRLLLVQSSHLDSGGRTFRTRRLPYCGLALPIVAALTPSSWDIEIVDDYHEEPDYDGGYDLVGVSAMTPQAPRSYKIADEFKRRGVPTVVGGFHGSCFPDEAAQHFTTVVIGEAEPNWPNVIRDFERGALRRRYESNALAEMSEVPIPRYDLLKSPPRYNVINRTGYTMRTLPAQTTRGCPMRCEFCSVHLFFGGSYRFRPVDRVVRDLKSANHPWFMFVDDNIAADRRYALELFEAIKPLKLTWGSQCNVSIAKDKELLRKASEAGCATLFLGVESLSREVLKRYNKSFNDPSTYEASFRKIYDAGIIPMISMIIGMDGDTAESMRATRDFLLRSTAGLAYVFILTPGPGTALFERFDREGRLLTKDWSRYNAQEVVFRPEGLGVEELQKGFWDILKEYYSIGRIVRRALWPPLRPFRWCLRLKANLLHRASVLQKVHPLRG